MSLRVKLASLVFTAMAAGSPAWAIDPFFPSFGNEGIDVIHYDLDLDVAPVANRLDAKATLYVRAETKLPSFTLDLHGLRVSRATINFIPVRFSQAGDKLTVKPLLPLPKGLIFRLDVAYAGTPDAITDPTDPSYELGWFHYQNATYVVSEPVGASTFFPANDEPTDKATFTTTLTVPAGYTGVANGKLIANFPAGSKRRFVWLMDEPMTTWLATAHVNRFTVTTRRSSDGIPVSVYATAATPAADVQTYLVAADIIPFYEKLIGRYPFRSYGSVVVDDPDLYYALETQAMTTFPLGFADEEVVAHELMHQWYGDSASVARWADLWIAEGTATYFELLWPNRNDPAAFDAAMRDLYDYAVSEPLGPAVVESGDLIFSDRTYVRGALALYALRLKVGERTFYNVLRKFHAAYRGGNATSQDFIRVAVAVSGDGSVRPLLRAWLFEEPVPPLPALGAGARIARGGPIARPNLVGLRCIHGQNRGAGKSCS